MAKKKESTSVDATIFVPRGAVREGDILKAALMSVRDEIPDAAMNVLPKVTSASDIKTDETGQEGRDYVVTITWTPRQVGARPLIPPDEDDEEEVPAVEKTLASLNPLTPEKLAAATDSGKLA